MRFIDYFQSIFLMKISKCSYYDIEKKINDGIGILIDIMNYQKFYSIIVKYLLISYPQELYSRINIIYKIK